MSLPAGHCPLLNISLPEFGSVSLFINSVSIKYIIYNLADEIIELIDDTSATFPSCIPEHSLSYFI